MYFIIVIIIGFIYETKLIDIISKVRVHKVK